MAAFVHEQKQDKAHRPFPTPDTGINADHQDHGAASLNQNWQQEFDFADELQNDNADKS